MRTYGISPLWRSTTGFDRFLDLVDAARHAAGDANYPPCNVERLSDDRYRISLALAGFSPDDIAITAEQNVLTVEGRKADEGQRKLLYRGISSRPFKRQFVLAAHVRVERARFVQRPAAGRVGSRDSGRHKASPDSDRQSVRIRRPADRARSGLKAGTTGSAQWPPQLCRRVQARAFLDEARTGRPIETSPIP